MQTTATIKFEGTSEVIQVVSNESMLALALDDIKLKMMEELEFAFKEWSEVSITVKR